MLGSLAASAREGRGAVVVNVSSDAGVNGYQRWGAYGASKAALLHLSRIWDEELRSEAVRVLSIDPGYMDTVARRCRARCRPLSIEAPGDGSPRTRAHRRCGAVAACLGFLLGF
jgi:NAD(P)-dependent dehydrogenase (short-subunit alcohol dehydrogenase family)